MADPTPSRQLISQLGQNINSSAAAMANQPGVAAAGLGLGVPKGFADIPTYLGAIGKGTWDYFRGNEPAPQGESFLDKYESGWRDAAINVGTLGQGSSQDELIQEQQEKAAASTLFMSSLASPSLPYGKLGKGLKGLEAAKGGAGGIAGSMAAKAKGTIFDATAQAAASPLAKGLDPLLVGAGKVTTKVSKQLDKVNNEFLANTLNPKSVTNYVKSHDPHILSQLSEVYGVPVSRLDDLGEPLYKKFKGLKSEGEISSNVDKFLDVELRSFDMSAKGKHLLKDELKTSIIYNKKYKDLDDSLYLYDRDIKGYNEVLKAQDDLIKLADSMTTPEDLRKFQELQTGIQAQLDNTDDIINNAQRLRTNYENKYFDALYSGQENTIKKSKELSIHNNQKIIEDLNKIDPSGKLAVQYDKAATESIVGNLGRVFNWFKSEPYIGDLTQTLESLPHAALNNAEALGINYGKSLQYGKEASKWVKKNNKLIQDTVIDKYRHSIQALQEQTATKSIFEGSNIKSLQDLKKTSLKDGLRAFGSAVDQAGYAFQSGARERMLVDNIIPRAYGQIKTWGKFAEGTPEFNKAVINHTLKFMDDLGMVPPKSKYIEKLKTASGKSYYKSHDHLDDWLQNKFKGQDMISKEARSASMFMTKWVKGAIQAKLQSYNNIKDTLFEIGKTGKVTNIQRAKVVNGVLEQALGLAIFGARGAKVPGAFTEFPELDSMGSPDDVPETATSWLVNEIGLQLGFDTELRNALREGLWGKLTGLSGARTESVPMFGAGLGSEISKGLILQRFEGTFEALFKAVETGDLSILGQGLLENIVPKDVDIASDVTVSGAPYSPSGNKMEVNREEHPLMKSSAIASAAYSTKNRPLEYLKQESFLDKNIEDIDKTITSKYERLSIQEFATKSTIRSIVTDLKSVYKDPSRVEKVLERILDQKITPTKSKIFKRYKGSITDLLALDTELVKEYFPELLNLSKKATLDLIAESAVHEKNGQTLLLLKKVGKLPTLDQKDKESIKKKIQQLYKDKLEIKKSYKESK